MKGGCKGIAYAEDLAVIVIGEFPQTLRNIMQSGMAGLGINLQST